MNEDIAIRREETKAYRNMLKAMCSFKGFLQNAQNEHTPFDLCIELTKKISQYVPISAPISQLFFTINAELVEVFLQEGRAKKENVTFFTDCKEKSDILKTDIRYKGIKVTDGDYLTIKDQPMKFKLTACNPPYQDASAGDAKRWPLWHRVTKAQFAVTEKNGMMITIIPSSCLTPGDMWDYLRKFEIVEIDLDVKRHFPGIGSTFCSVICINKSPTGKKTKFISSGQSYDIDISANKFIPPSISNTLIELGKKVFQATNSWKFVRTSEYHTSKKHLFADDGRIDVFHTNAQTPKTNVPHANNDLYRVAVTLSGYHTFKYIHGEGCSQAVAWMDCGTHSEAIRRLNILNSKLYQFILKTYKYSGWNSLDVIKSLPSIDDPNVQSDGQIYNHFNLSPEEIALIEETIK